MMKYRIPFLFVFALVLGCAKNTSLTKPLLDFVPKNASVVIKINNLSTLRNGFTSNSFFNDLNKVPTFKKALEKVQFITLLNPKSKSILALVENETGDLESVYIADDATDMIMTDSLANLTKEEFAFRGLSLTKYQIDERAFYQTTLANKFVMASSAPLIEELIENLKNNKASETLQKLYKISNGYKPATLYLDLKKSRPWFATILKNTSQLDVSKFSDWISLDFNPKPTQVNLTGISMAKDSIWNYVDLFANTKPLTNITPALAPLGIDVMVSYTFDDYATFAENQKSYLAQDISRDLLFETVEEVGLILENKQKGVVLSTHGSETLVEHLEQEKRATLDYQGNQILSLKNSGFIEGGFKPLVQNFQSNFCTFINDALVFTETKEFLEQIIRSNKNGLTYHKGSTFQGLGKSLAEESNILFMSNSTSLRQVFQPDFSEGFDSEFKTTLKSKYNIAAQITADKNFYHTNIVIEKDVKKVGTKGISELFTTKIDTSIINSPQFLTNHLTKKKEIAIQDYDNILYLISPGGKILWKKQLEGQIQGTIRQVDIFKNGQLQMAFTTNNQFLILDRNGKELERFTKTFEGGGLNPLAVFDYDRKREYRFVVTQGKKTFMYNNKASIVDGFKYTDAEEFIIDAPKHFRIGAKDFLVFRLKNGSLKILNRVGDIRVKVTEKIDFSENEVYLNKDKFTLTDKRGTLYQIDQWGKVAKTNFNLSNDHGMFATANTLVLMNDNVLTIRGKKVELELGVYTAPKIFYINNKIYVSVTDLQSQKVFLFDSQAKPISNFPVFGNSVVDLADIDGDKTLEMVALGKRDELITYKLN